MAFNGNRLRAWRKEKDLSLVVASGKFNITAQHLSCIERGKREPSGQLLEGIISATGLNYEELRTHPNPPPPPTAPEVSGAERKTA